MDSQQQLYCKPLGARKVDLAKSFSALPAEQRRPVELAGLLQLATTLGIDLARCKHATYECVGLDGRTALWSGPHIMLTTAQMDQSRRGLS